MPVEDDSTKARWAQIRASAWPPEPVDDHEDPVDDEGESPTSVSWGYPGNPVLPGPSTIPNAATSAPAARYEAAPRSGPTKTGWPAPSGVSSSATGPQGFRGPARAYYSATPTGTTGPQGTSATVPFGATSPGVGHRRSDPPPRDNTGSQGRRRADPTERPTDVGFSQLRAAPPSNTGPIRPSPQQPAHVFEDDEPERSDAWSSYSPNKPRRSKAAAPPPPPPARVSSASASASSARTTSSSTVRIVVAAAMVLAGVGLLGVGLARREAAPVVVDPPVLPVVGGPTPTAEPPRPFDLAAPAKFRPTLLDGKNASTPEALAALVAEAESTGQLDLAAAAADQLARTTSDPATFYGLGELLASNHQIDAAFYWLTRAVNDHGVRPERFIERPSFADLWGDARWDAFSRWSVQVRRYQTAKGSAPPKVIVPEDLAAALALDAARRPPATEPKPRTRPVPTLPVLFWFEPADGSSTAPPGWAQQLANDLGVVVVDILGPDRVGPNVSAWSGDPARDRAQVDAAIAAITQVAPDPERRFLAGVGQGGTWAVELTLRDPAFAGALALHPTDEWRGPRDGAAEGNRDRKQSVMLVAGADDDDVHAFVRLERGRLVRAGVETQMEFDTRRWSRGVPSDLGTRVSAWMRDRVNPPKKPQIGEMPPAPPIPPPAPSP